MGLGLKLTKKQENQTRLYGKHEGSSRREAEVRKEHERKVSYT
jgi:hypothetical protein